MNLMRSAFLAPLFLALLGCVVQGLSQDLIDIRKRFNPEDRYNDQWLDWLHDYIYELGDDDTFHSSLMR